MSHATQPGGAPLLAAEEEKLTACVHCGFCLTTCPTYVRLGNEADSPRGRLHLMRAVGEGRIAPSSNAFATHIDACVGCRACETACPAGVEFGFLLQRARATIAEHKGRDLPTRLLLWVFASVWLTRLFGVFARLARRLPLSARVHAAAPSTLWARVRFARLMLAASKPRARAPEPSSSRGAPLSNESPVPPFGASPVAEPNAPPARELRAPSPAAAPSVALLDGCVQSALFGHVNDATARVLEANGCAVRCASKQRCCGALHAHAGDLETAKALARANIEAFEASGAELYVSNSAGCGAALKEYGALFDAADPVHPRAVAFSAKVRDATELLAALGPRAGAPLPMRAGYDAPCHLEHGMKLGRAPLTALKGVAQLEVVPIKRSDECCGGAGMYSLLHPELAGRILFDKVSSVNASRVELLVTANPGCILQVGAGLRWYGAATPVVHATELLDESYERAGFYGPRRS